MPTNDPRAKTPSDTRQLSALEVLQEPAVAAPHSRKRPWEKCPVCACSKDGLHSEECFIGLMEDDLDMLHSMASAELEQRQKLEAHLAAERHAECGQCKRYVSLYTKAELE